MCSGKSEARRVPTKKCQNNWTEYRNKCYYFHEELVTLKGAFEACKAKNATLVFIRNERENNFLESYSKPRDRHWIGMRELAHRYYYQFSDLRWMDGSEMNYTHWSRDEPELRYSCMGAGFVDGQWFIQECNDKMKAICQSGNENTDVKLMKIEEVFDVTQNITDKINSLEESILKLELDFEVFKHNSSELLKSFQKRVQEDAQKLATHQVSLNKKIIGTHSKIEEIHELRRTDSKHSNVWLLILTSLTVFIALVLIVIFFHSKIQFFSIFNNRSNTVRLTDSEDI
ncbi:C-type mannose receptor 2-like protein [Leptotrombidium deliense]|uniref:C-type mannose receptor 2-like protein n=1 Tax=Leptotrombidium deliense TaxID=299467 RepID=A0A443SBT2_9ACAR|nr:C-type mannose receptor 2-like protein [Leptotrombidium deliense]